MRAGGRIGRVRAPLAALGALAFLLAALGAGLSIASALGVDLRRRQVPEARQGLEAYLAEDFARAGELFEKARTDLEGERGALELDRGLASARLGKADEASVSLRRAAGQAEAPAEVRSAAHLALGNLALGAHRDLEAIEEYRHALRLWPENREAAWNLSLARRRLAIDACRLVEPPTLQATAGQQTGEVTGEVFEEHRTSEPGALEGLRAEVGFGSEGSEPNDVDWLWRAAEYAGESEQGGAERYVGTFTAPEFPGRYDYAFRFRQPGGPWSYCDLDGSAERGYTADQAGQLTVVPPGNRCAMVGPPWLIVAPSQETEPVDAAVAVPEGERVGEVQVGFGPDGSEPAAGDGWTWSAARLEGQTEAEVGSIGAGSPRYRGGLRPTEAGRYDYAFRFRPEGVSDWIYCDFGGSDDGYSPEGAGDMVVRDLPREGCLLDRPPRTQAGPGQPTEAIRALVHQQGEELAPLRVEIGHGPDGSEPDAETWTWSLAEPGAEAPPGFAAFETGLTAPESEGSYDYAVRVRRGGQAAAWVYCDLDGSANGYQAAMAGELLVQDQQQDEQDDQQDEQDDQQDEQDDQQDEQDDQQDRQDRQEQEQEQELPEDMESVLDALEQNERTFLPPRSPRQVINDW